MNDFFRRYGLRPVLNASGTETVHGASRASRAVVEAVGAILPASVEIAELQKAASGVIARVTGAEAGMVTGCSAAGIAVCVAAAMAGRDLARAEQLPDTRGLKNRVVIQKGHNINFGGEVGQMARIAGASLVEIGTANSAGLYQLEAALDDQVAAALYVVSHHTVQNGMIDLASFVHACSARGVPVIVDAAAEYGWAEFLATGAAALIFSAQKAPAGTTAGIIAGTADFVAACYMQEFGIGRPMKAGKEAIAGAMAALELWHETDHAAVRAAERARLDLAERLLGQLPGIGFAREPDPTGNPFERLALRIEPAEAGIDARALGQALMAGEVKVCLRMTRADTGTLLLDVRRIDETELELIAAKIRRILADPPQPAPGAARLTNADNRSAAAAAWGAGR